MTPEMRHLFFETGAQARYEGIAMADCPYSGDDADSRQAASDWVDGWLAADADVRAKAKEAS